MKSLPLGLICLVLAASPLLAGEVHVQVVLSDDWMRTFEHTIVVKGIEAAELPRATLADCRPYVEEAKKALANHRGYTPRFFGEVHHKISQATRLVEVRVLDPDGRLLHRVRRGRQPRRAEARSPFGAPLSAARP